MDESPREDRVVPTITVYSYWTWVPGEGLGAIAAAKRTRRQIEDLYGLAIAVTAEEVDVRDLDPDGAYKPRKPVFPDVVRALALP